MLFLLDVKNTWKHLKNADSTYYYYYMIRGGVRLPLWGGMTTLGGCTNTGSLQVYIMLYANPRKSTIRIKPKAPLD